MTIAQTLDVHGALAALQAAQGRSGLRVWMEKHYDEVRASLDGKRISWIALCGWFREVGLTDALGQVPSIKCAKITWFRVGRWLRKRREKAEAKAAELAAQAEALRADQEARREAARVRIQEEEQEAALLRQRAEEAQRAMEYRREREAQPPIASRFARPAAPVVPAAQPGPDGELPPVQKGEMNPRTGNPYQFGGDLPGYPSKRGYEREEDWLRVVSRMLRAKHPDSNANMTLDEKKTIMRAQSHRFIAA